MVVNYKHLGAILGSIGSFFVLMIGQMAFSHSYYTNWYYLIIGVTTTLIGAFGMYGSILAIRDNTRGYKYLLGAGAIGVVSTFIPISIYEYTLIYPPVHQILYLVETSNYLELILMVIGGVLGLTLAEKKERKEHHLEYKYLGATVGLIGSLLLFSISLLCVSFFHYQVDYHHQYILINIIGIFTTLISAFGMYGSVLAFKDDARGYTYLLVAGAIGVVGTFIPIFASESSWNWPPYIHIFYLVSTAYYIDLILMVVGGVLGFALAEKKERKE